MAVLDLLEKLDRYDSGKYEFSTPSFEMISEQVNDYVVGKIEDQFQQLINLKIKGGSSDYFKNPKSVSIINNIDTFIKDRFGINAKHINGKNIGYACLPVAPLRDNVLNRDIVKQTDYVKKVLKREELNYDKNKRKDYDEDQLAIYNHLVEMREAITEAMKKEPVFINLKEAKIQNLPDSYQAYFIADFHLLINIGKCTAAELTAVLFHEIGHVFTHLEYSIRTAQNVQVLTDSVRDIVMKQNRGTKDMLKMVYEKNTNMKVPKEFERMKTTEAALFVANGLASDKILDLNTIKKNTSLQDHSFTDSEQLADQFAGRFGLGGPLSTALNKLMAIDSGFKLFHMIMYVGNDQMISTSIFLALLAIITAGGSLILLGILWISFLSAALLNCIFRKSFYSEEVISSGMTYDDIRRRFMRIKNELVRQIPSVDDKDVRKQILNSILMVEKQMDAVPQAHSGIFEKIVMFFQYDKDAMRAYKRTEQMLENLISNDLHVSKVMIENIRSK